MTILLNIACENYISSDQAVLRKKLGLRPTHFPTCYKLNKNNTLHQLVRKYVQTRITESPCILYSPLSLSTQDELNNCRSLLVWKPLNVVSDTVRGNRVLTTPLNDHYGICFQKLRKQSDLQLIRCVQVKREYFLYNFIQPLIPEWFLGPCLLKEWMLTGLIRHTRCNIQNLHT